MHVKTGHFKNLIDSGFQKIRIRRGKHWNGTNSSTTSQTFGRERKSELHNKEILNFTTKRRNSYSTNFVEE